MKSLFSIFILGILIVALGIDVLFGLIIVGCVVAAILHTLG